MEIDGVYLGCRVSKILKNEVEKTAQDSGYLNASDFIREAIREKLSTLKKVQSND